MPIPACVKLSKEQQDVYEKWVKSLPQSKLEEACEEDCCGMSPITFRIYSSGLGDVILACFGNTCVDLSEGG